MLLSEDSNAFIQSLRNLLIFLKPIIGLHRQEKLVHDIENLSEQFVSLINLSALKQIGHRGRFMLMKLITLVIYFGIQGFQDQRV